MFAQHPLMEVLTDLLGKVAEHSFTHCVNEVRSWSGTLGRPTQRSKSPFSEGVRLSRCHPLNKSLFPIFLFAKQIKI